MILVADLSWLLACDCLVEIKNQAGHHRVSRHLGLWYIRRQLWPVLAQQ